MAIFHSLQLAGAYLVEPERREDSPGFFVLTRTAMEFAQHHITAGIVECNISCNTRRGTLRGMHYQAAPHAQAKLVRCTSGSIYDVIVDLRPDSPTSGAWFAAELSAS